MILSCSVGLSAFLASEASYTLLRRVENFVQGLRDRQTHDLPTSERDRARLALAMGEPDWGHLAGKLDDARSLVREQFARLVFAAPPAGAAPARTLKRVARILTAVTRRSARRSASLSMGRAVRVSGIEDARWRHRGRFAYNPRLFRAVRQ